MAYNEDYRMITKPKFISQPIVDEFSPFHKFYIELSTDHQLTHKSFHPKYFNDYFINFLELLSKKSPIFESSKWFFLDSIDGNKKDNPIFAVKDSDQANSFLYKYNKSNDINSYGYSIPMVMDYSLINADQCKQYYFTYDHYFTDTSHLGLYDSLMFCFVEEYNSQHQNMKIDTLEAIMKCMVENLVKYKFNFKFVNLFDSDFNRRESPDENENFYTETYQVYPHRLVCAWKCIVKGDFNQQDIPQAAKVDNFMKGYTLVSTLPDGEYFSSYNSDHIYKANLVEIRLKELGLLPYHELLDA